MARPTYTANVIVLRKTKLKETDLILTCLTEDGSQLRFVAKGARKPNNTFSSRLELFANTHVLAVRGKSLDIVKEAKLIHGNKGLRESIERMAAASVICELTSKCTQPRLEVKKLYPMVARAFECMNKCSPEQVATIAVAALLKTYSYLGFQPELRHCIVCGGSLSGARSARDEGLCAEVCGARGGCGGAWSGACGARDKGVCAGGSGSTGAECAGTNTANLSTGGVSSVQGTECAGENAPRAVSDLRGTDSHVAFSYTDGGAVCSRCASRVNSVQMSAEALRSAQFLLYSTFADILGEEAGNEHSCDEDAKPTDDDCEDDCEEAEHSFVSKELLQFCKAWAKAQLGVKLKSMEFLLSLS